MTTERDNPLHSAQQQFDKAAELLGLPQGIRAVLRVPQREFIVNFGGGGAILYGGASFVQHMLIATGTPD
jgi:hypothetical protein